ncbi:hypothetical protein B0H13DRAFT_1994555 [Mycena leptocephala]|nr:hypothetical protein B0H13DRAFT_1994555 [Mycena leptocephala]
MSKIHLFWRLFGSCACGLSPPGRPRRWSWPLDALIPHVDDLPSACPRSSPSFSKPTSTSRITSHPVSRRRRTRLVLVDGGGDVAHGSRRVWAGTQTVTESGYGGPLTNAGLLDKRGGDPIIPYSAGGGYPPLLLACCQCSLHAATSSFLLRLPRPDKHRLSSFLTGIAPSAVW